MSDRTPPFAVPSAVEAPAERHWDSSVGTGLLGRLTGADYLSLAGLFLAWTSALLLLEGAVHEGILATCGAIAFDELDGYYARSRGVDSSFGRQVDSFIDVFVYLVTGALLYHVALSPSRWASLLVGFAIVAFGGLRLIRHAAEGFGESDGTSYYVGWTVVHVHLLVLAAVYADLFVGVSGWWASVPIVAACPLLVSGYKSYKTDAGHAAGGVLLGLAAVTSALVAFTGVL